ncbi:hypothetical protein PO909_024406 [Leuciscus waleckii]
MWRDTVWRRKKSRFTRARYTMECNCPSFSSFKQFISDCDHNSGLTVVQTPAERRDPIYCA